MESPRAKEEAVVIANCSGFFGDRLSAAREMVRGGPIDFLTGDYLAELTMAILFRKRLKDANGGYVPTFLQQMEEVMGECLDRGIRVVSNAGGLSPRALARELEKIAERLGLRPRIAFIEGDDLIGRLDDLQQRGEPFVNLDKGVGLAEAEGPPITANAYLGCWGIVDALDRNADIVVGGRIADAALAVGPAAWKLGWRRDDWDPLAGAAVAGHIIECGAQATGGNYSFFEEVPTFENLGFPIAEIRADGSSVITKHPGTGGLVSVDTIKAQLLYEIGPPHYLTPDVVARFDAVRISQQAPDRVLIENARGEPPTGTTKVCINNLGGHRNSVTVLLTGLDIEKKARIVEETLFSSLGGKDQFQTVDLQLTRSDRDDPESNEEATAQLRISVLDPDADLVGRRFSAKVVELATTTIPGFTLAALPSRGMPAVVSWPALVSNEHVPQHVHVDGEMATVPPVSSGQSRASYEVETPAIPDVPRGKRTRLPLGRIFAARSGDKGGNVDLGVWGRSPEAFAFLRQYLTVEKLRQLAPEVRDLEIERFELPNLFAVNFVIRDLLGGGAAASLRFDPQGKTFAEYVRARVIEVPESIIE